MGFWWLYPAGADGCATSRPIDALNLCHVGAQNTNAALQPKAKPKITAQLIAASVAAFAAIRRAPT
jgi:hypothetical protein